MLKTTLAGIFLAGTLMSPSLFAATPHAMKSGTTIEVDLEPKVPQSFSNPAYWPVEGTCKVSTVDESNDLYALMKSRSGSVNGTKLKKGESITVTIKDGDVFKMQAEAGAEVEITNLGENTVHAKCKAN